MAIKRLKAIQDTFIVKNTSESSFGADEVLELGHCLREDAEGCSRILLEFMVNEVEALIGRNSLMRATLNLKYAHAENLPPVWGVDITELESEWAEGVGHVYDKPGNPNGASWYRPKGIEKEEYWDGGLLLDEASDIQEDEIEFPIWKHEYFTGYQADKDLCIDVTEWVYNWLTNPEAKGLGFLIKLTNEELADEMQTRICFYSSKTHTVYYPYLELVIDDHGDDREVPEGTPVADPTNLYIGVKNLKESYYIGDKVRLDLTVRPEYPRRVYSTSSLYRDTDNLLPRRTRWGIRDEYTGEMVVGFGTDGTRCGYDERGNYITLDTDLLEPERYYRLLFEVDNGVSRKVYDSRGIFRVTRYGEI